MVSVDEKVDEKKSRGVETGPIVFDELPPAPERKPGGGGGSSEFDRLLREVAENPPPVGGAISIKRYVNESAVKAAANVLRQRYGRTVQAAGYEFHVRIDPSGAGVWHLMVVCDPSKIVEGAWEKHVEAEIARVKKTELKKVARARDAAREAAREAAATASS